MRKAMAVLILAVFLAGAVQAESEKDIHHGLNYSIAGYLAEKGIPQEAVIGLIATLPIVELRGAVPVAHFMGMNGWLAYILSVLGNMVPVIPILLLLGPVSGILMRWKWGKIFFEWLFARTRRKSELLQKYEIIGLTLFVAIPLPVTGAWTGCVAAFLFGFSIWKSFGCILLGVMISGGIMTLLSLMGWMGAVIAGIAILCLLLLSLYSKLKSA